MVQATTTTTTTLRNNNDNDAVLKVSTTIKSAAESIRQRSYAFLLIQQHRQQQQQQQQQQVGVEDDGVDVEEEEEGDKGEPSSSVNSIIKSIRTAEKEAKSYLCNANLKMSVEDKLKHHQVIHQGHLLGFNQPPGNAKYLFRSFVNNRKQPWPSETFKDASTRVASHLHQILIECYEEIVRSTGTRQDEYKRTKATKETNDEKGGQYQPPTTTVTGKKRPRTSSSSSPSDHHHLLPRSFQNNTTITNCPLDYFYYHCRNNNPDAINCSEHIDRGILICVCLSNNVPGLEVFDNETKQWLCPEEELMQHSRTSSGATTTIAGVGGGNNNDNDNNVQEQHEDDNIIICIMAGDSLQRNLSNALVVDADTIPPCLHRVRNNLKSPRLSISYELRT